MAKKPDAAERAATEISSLLVGRFISISQIEAIRNSLSRGEMETMVQAAAGGLALALAIIEEQVSGEGRSS